MYRSKNLLHGMGLLKQDQNFAGDFNWMMGEKSDTPASVDALNRDVMLL